jgi:predicted ATPase/DNA-binding CsgD family transcriptional regulator
MQAENQRRRSNHATNLLSQLTSFVGREQELAEVERLLFTTRLFTLTGPGGIGKTRLALEVATRLLPRFADGVWIVDLAPIAETHLVAQALAQALVIRKEAHRSLLPTLIEVLQDRHLLLVLDNCEHLVLACAELAAALLHACSGLSFLATSREALGVGGELLWRLPSLSVPQALAASPAQAGVASAVELIRPYEAVQLFLERATAVRTDFRLTRANGAAIAQICQRLDGIPLAIELAAARVQVLSPEQIAERLADRFGLLTSGSRLALPRQQTLRATLDWSYSLLSEQEQVLLQRLSVFAGNWALQAAEAVCPGEDIGACEVLDGLTNLVNKSLVMMEEREEQACYRLLETVRQYAWEKLAGTGEDAHLRDQHLAYFLTLVRAAEPRFSGAEQSRWIRRLEQAYANLRVACDWAIDNQQWEQGLHLAAGLWPFWEISGRAAEGCEWLEAILQRTEQVGQTPARGQALLACGCLATQLSDYPLAQRCLEESLTVSRAQNDPQRLALALSSFGWYYIYIRDAARGRALLEESLALYEQVGDRSGLAITLGRLAWTDFAEEQYQRARTRFEQALILLRELGDAYSLANTLVHLGELTRFEGNDAQAEPLYLEALRYYQKLGHATRGAMALSNLGEVARARGDFARALALITEALLINLHRQGSKEHIYSGLVMLGGTALQLGELELSARLYGAAEVLRETYHVTLNLTDQAQYERDLTALQVRLDAVTCQAAWKEGRALSPEEAVALLEPLQQAAQAVEKAEQGASPSSVSTSTAKYPADLTAREVGVLDLLARGLTNKQIAEALVISPKTVSRHVESIFSKLGVGSRAAAVRFAMEQKLV